jgi:hypothetical protein
MALLSENVYWIHLAQCRFQWWDITNTALYRQVSYKQEFLDQLRNYQILKNDFHP